MGFVPLWNFNKFLKNGEFEAIPGRFSKIIICENPGENPGRFCIFG